MGSITIVNAVLILTIAGSTLATNKEATIETTTRSKRDLTTPVVASIIWAAQSMNSPTKEYPQTSYTSTSSSRDPLQSSTTINTVPTQNPPTSATRVPPGSDHRQVKYKESTRNGPSARGDVLHSSANGQPPLQGGFQVSNVQYVDHRFPQMVYRKNPQSYLPQGNHQFSNKVLLSAHEDSQYFPNTYRVLPETSRATGHFRTMSYPKSSGFPPFPKFKSSSSTLSPSTYFSTHSPQNSGSSQRSKASSYKGDTFPAGKVDARPSTYSEFSGSPTSFESYDKLGQNYNQYGGSHHHHYPNKNPSPVSLQLQDSPEVTAALIKAFETKPVLLNSGVNYQTESGFNYDHPKSASLSNGPNTFDANAGNYQPRVHAIHSPSSTSRIPHYQAASVNGFSPNAYENPVDSYEQLTRQPQFHFTGNQVRSSNQQQQPIVHHSKPFEQIRSDAEVIDKKRLTTPKPYDNDDDDFEPDFKAVGREFGYGNGRNSRPTNVPSLDGSFELPASNLFNSYDQAFGKYSKLASYPRVVPEKPRQPLIEHSVKPVHQSVEEDDDAGQRDDKSSSGEYHSSYTDDRPEETNSSYEEEEDEEESQRNERLKNDDESNERIVDDDDDDDDDDAETAAFKSYGADYEKEFEESYDKELPKSEYKHVKEVPEIDESTSETKKNPANRVKNSRVQGQKKNHPYGQSEYQPKKYGTQRRGASPKNYYRDNEGHGSRTEYKKTKVTEPILEETYGKKILRDRGTTRYGKVDETSSRLNEPTTKTLYTPESQGHFDKFTRSSVATTPLPLTSTISSFETVQSYTFPPFSSWKMNKKVPKDQDSYGGTSGQEVRAIFSPDNSNSRQPQVQLETVRFFTNDQILRDLRGI